MLNVQKHFGAFFPRKRRSRSLLEKTDLSPRVAWLATFEKVTAHADSYAPLFRCMQAGRRPRKHFHAVGTRIV
jgi:hypothetical protein